MKAKSIRYERLYNLGNYAHKKIAIEIEIEEGELAQDVLNRAKTFCLLNEDDYLNAVYKAEYVAANPKDHTGAMVDEAKAKLAEYAKYQEDIPF
jgi:hypothetical protein